jgi:hypothetical protein
MIKFYGNAFFAIPHARIPINIGICSNTDEWFPVEVIDDGLPVQTMFYEDGTPMVFETSTHLSMTCQCDGGKSPGVNYIALKGVETWRSTPPFEGFGTGLDIGDWLTIDDVSYFVSGLVTNLGETGTGKQIVQLGAGEFDSVTVAADTVIEIIRAHERLVLMPGLIDSIMIFES